MLPNKHHPHDRQWLVKQLGKLPFEVRQKICEKYDQVYQEACDSEPVDFRKDNAGRYAANTRLRKYIEKVG